MKHNAVQMRNMQPPILMTLISSSVFVLYSKISGKHFSSEKYNTIKSFKQHFPQNNPLLLICISASGSTGFENIPGNHFV
jgi:hypothetical protein